MSIAHQIWIIDDDPDVRKAFSYALIHGGYGISEYRDGAEALAQLEADPPALIILDIDMPKLNGWQTLVALRERGYAKPIIMITGTNDVNSRVKGLELGADDYVGKPCVVSELLARVKALLRRSAPPFPPSAVLLQQGDLSIDVENKIATKAGVPLRLTRTDYALLKLLSKNVGKPVSREIILREVWEAQSGNSHALDTHLWRLRGKLGDTSPTRQWIQNIPGIGFMMTAIR
jgi:two-component system, OmpR family, response regulator MprA